jgi:hypothetical protein
MPTPSVEEPERFPGGPDALADQSRYGEIPEGPIGVDLPPDKNPVTASAEVDVPEVTDPDESRTGLSRAGGRPLGRPERAAAGRPGAHPGAGGPPVIGVGDMPTPSVEEPERYPGGPDALDDQSRYGEIPKGPIGVDLPPDKNPVTATADLDVPEITDPDDKSQEPDESDDQVRESDEPETPV